MVLTLPISLVGEIKDIVNRIENVLEKFHIEILDDNFSIDSTIDLKIPNDVLIHYSTDNEKSVLNIICLVPKKNESLTATENIKINLKNITKYNITILNKSNSSINKNLKKKKLQNIKTLENGSLFNLNDSFFLYIDNNGFVQYYSDSLEILSQDEFFNYLLPKHFLNDSEMKMSNLPLLIEKNRFLELDLNFNPNTYSLYLNNPLPLSNTLENINNESNSFLGKIGSAISTGLGYLNIFSYYNNSETNGSIISTSSNQDNKNKYYINTNTLTIVKYDTIKNNYKILKPKNITLPIYIESLECDDENNIVFSGKFNQTSQTCSISYNKFFLHENIKIFI